MIALAAILIGVVGLTVGSFLNVVIYRVPRGESVLQPRSHCPFCSAGIRPRDEVPVLSWLLLRGRCRDCGARISPRYPLVEAVTAAVFVSFALRLGVTAQLPAFLYLAAVGVALAVIDLDTRRLPDVLVLPSYPVGLAALGIAALATGAYGQLGRACVGMAALFAFYFLLAFIYPAGMGFGDVKLAGVVGLYLAWLGWGSLLVGAFTGFLLGGVAGVAMLLTGRAGRKTAIPYGPFMLAGAFVAVLVGQQLSSAYTGLTLG
jgi:leader peptidase (prepilin peptidase)/N-methyltransferase